jgi:riboflavin kinase / FMN adenylyltransferase
VWITSDLNTILTPTRVALGNFDGLHLGHRAVINQVCQPSETIDPDARSTVVSFNPHPHTFFSGETRTLLTPFTEKVALLENQGVQQFVLLPFNQELASLSPEAFVEKILVTHPKAQQVSVGFNFHFGHKRSGNVTHLETIASRYGIEVMIAAPKTLENDRISSSAIRQALQSGEIERANQLLGRFYCLTGVVVQGQQMGRKLGFPTANLEVSPEKFLPRNGVYRVAVEIEGLPQPQQGVMNLGVRPTLEGMQQTLEVHILDWSGNLYGTTVTVSLEQFLRPEQKFASLEALSSQIQMDCETARQQFTSASANV